MEADQRNTPLDDLRARRPRIGEALVEAGVVCFEAFVTEIMKVGKRGEKLRAIAKRRAPGTCLASQSNARAGLEAGRDGQACEEEFPSTEYLFHRHTVTRMRALPW